jgi:hypothetical protein
MDAIRIIFFRGSKMNKFVSRGLVVAGVLAAVGSAQAAAIDVSGTVTEIASQAAPVALIGGAVLAIFVAVKAFKWVRAALS